MEIKNSPRIEHIYRQMVSLYQDYRHEYIMPEHLLLAMTEDADFSDALGLFGVPVNELADPLRSFLSPQEKLPEGSEQEMLLSVQLQQVIAIANSQVQFSSARSVDITHVTEGILKLTDSYANSTLMHLIGNHKASFLGCLISLCEAKKKDYGDRTAENADENDDLDSDEAEDSDDLWAFGDEETNVSKSDWHKQVVCMNDMVEGRNPLIGREAELERTIQVLSRKEKNNPLHVGEPGVGKTALVYGLVQLIANGNVPEQLKGCRVYQLDLSSIVSGTQYRGDFEKRIKQIMDGASEEGNAIIYIDEIHNLVGTGAVGESSLDASNMLKPYLERGEIKFIGSTTYDEFNRFFSRSKGLVRRFQQIDIAEPSVEETITILQGLKSNYESFHGVSYDDEAIEFAVRASAKYVNERFLPDKAIDLIDEAGAWRKNHPLADAEKQTVDKLLIADVLARVCKVEAMADADDDNQRLMTLRERITAKIYGQDEAVRQVVEAVQMAKAGLLDDNKPLASLLFVGPTGVGKTEVAKVLAQELGIELVRFDMSEYTEKHTVAKLIGSPAGYVGYEDGGLLTDAIRKTPNCVLLLDEIEKAHADIYNILLQVMDYARLTDNKGRKADFRNVVLIMTSNAGAQYASQASVGFNSHVSRGEAMLAQAKKTFKPEFRNRLSGTVVFNDMDRTMATLILKKKLRELQAKLTAKNVSMTLTDEAFAHLLDKGFTREYGAREMDRVISSELKPLLMREILFGQLKNGGEITVCFDNGLQIRR